MQLFKFELYKIFKQRFIYVAFLASLALSLSFGIDPTSELEQNLYKKWEGTLTEEKMAEVEVKNDEMVEKTKDYKFYHDMPLGDQINRNLYTEILTVDSKQGRIDHRLEELQNESNYHTALEKGMLESIDLSYFSYHKGPVETVRNIGFFYYIITGIMILIGLSSIYSSEYSSGMDNYMLSSKNGRKPLLRAKIGAAMIYTTVVVFVWELWNVLFNLIQLGVKGWGMPLQTMYEFYFSPYSFTLFEYHLIQMGMHLLGALGFTLFVVMISSICRNVLLTFFICGSAFALPIFMYDLIQNQWVDRLLELTYSFVMKVDLLFDSFSTINVMGQPVLFPVIAVVWIVVISILIVFVTTNIIKNKQVE